ncbi:HD-GYP domain-containing protein [Novosphingobium aquimarinum]|uniref:HD-GYP domain-containing protein n=1 Tax=Novosphingobium aquimarinum TaxID=2682494 RepID=UPI001E2E0AEE|nr:DUF3391 domain-containing protein [Novosphingobium aquimarinum]
MLKRISTSQIELGMFVHKLEGSWFSHPFWKSRFLLESPDILDTLRNSALDAVIIDIEKGCDVAPEPRPVAKAAPLASLQGRTAFRSAAARPNRAAKPPVMFAGTQPTSGPVPITREFGNARLTAGKARKVISKVFLEARLGKSPKIAEVEPVVEDIYGSIQRNPFAFSGLMRCKSDQEVAYRHSLSVSAMMVSLARQMKLTPLETREAGMAGLLMNIGVAQIDVDLNANQGKFDKIDPELLFRHTSIGYDLLKACDEIPHSVARVALNHHEVMDGKGFPQGLVGDEIDLFSRMAAVCDTYDHLLCGAYDGTGMDPAAAVTRLQADKSRYDSNILERFIETVGVYPIGTFVELESGRVAMVVDQDPAAPDMPTVRAFYSLERRRHVTAETIALSVCYGSDAIKGIASLEGLELPDAAQLREKLLTAAIRSAR